MTRTLEDAAPKDRPQLSCLRGEKRVIFGCHGGEGPLWGPSGPVFAFWPSSTNRLVSFSSNNVFRFYVLLACLRLSFSSAIEDTEGQRL